MRGVGTRGLVRPSSDAVTRERAAVLRLLLACAGWAIGQTLSYALSLGQLGIVVAAAGAIGALFLTQDLGRPARRGGEIKYWRGRRIDDRRD